MTVQAEAGQQPVATMIDGETEGKSQGEMEA